MAPRSRGDQARVKRCGKSAPGSGASRNAGKPRSEQGQIEGRLRSSERSAAPGCCPRVGCIDPAGDDGTREMAAARRSRRGTESGLQALLTHSFPSASFAAPVRPPPLRGPVRRPPRWQRPADGARSVPSFLRRQESRGAQAPNSPSPYRDLCITPRYRAGASQFTPSIKRNCGLQLSYAKVSYKGRGRRERGGRGYCGRGASRSGIPHPYRHSRVGGNLVSIVGRTGRFPLHVGGRPPVGSRFRGNDEAPGRIGRRAHGAPSWAPRPKAAPSYRPQYDSAILQFAPPKRIVISMTQRSVVISPSPAPLPSFRRRPESIRAPQRPRRGASPVTPISPGPRHSRESGNLPA